MSKPPTPQEAAPRLALVEPSPVEGLRSLLRRVERMSPEQRRALEEALRRPIPADRREG